MRAILVILALAGIGAGVFFWRQSEDYRTRLEGLTADLTAANTALADSKAFDDEVNGLDRAFARGLNGQDAIARDFARLATGSDQAELRAALEARIGKLREDLVPAAGVVRERLLKLDPPDYTLDPAAISDEANAAFLARIDADPAFTRTPSGLRYRKIKTVDVGLQPTAEDQVIVHYKGTFIEGTEFDSSYKRNEPANFPLGNLITGWVEGIPLMKVGETFEFVLPYDLAYGIAGRGPIPPRQTLVFQVELVAVPKTVP